MLYILMYPVLRITFMLNFLDTFGMGVTYFNIFSENLTKSLLKSVVTYKK